MTNVTPKIAVMRRTCTISRKQHEASILLKNYYLPGDLEQRIGEFVDYYNHERYHESLNNLTPADVYYGRGQQVLDRREQIKLNTLAMRREMHYDNQMKLQTLMS